MAVKHTSEIKFQIGLDENRVPEEISWTAKEGGIEHMSFQGNYALCLGSIKTKILCGWIYGRKTCL